MAAAVAVRAHHVLPTNGLRILEHRLHALRGEVVRGLSEAQARLLQTISEVEQAIQQHVVDHPGDPPRGAAFARIALDALNPITKLPPGLRRLARLEIALEDLAERSTLYL